MVLAGVIAVWSLTSCAENPASGRQNFVMVSQAQEEQAGRQGDAEIKQEFGVYNAPGIQAYVNSVGQRVAQRGDRPNIAYHFTVLDSPDINAFALPGGYVYITRGIMAYLGSEAELAAVLGHEIGHVTARHAVRQQSAAQAANIGVALGSIFFPQLRSQGAQSIVNVLGGAVLSGYGREYELEADRLGSAYIARAGYNPEAMVRVISVLKDQEAFGAETARQEGRQVRSYHGLFASHPDNDTRLRQVVGEAQRDARGTMEENRAAYLRHLDGMVFGDSPDQGLVRGSTFTHPKLGFALSFPDGWRIENQPQKVIATSPGNDAFLQLQPGGPAQGSPAEFLRNKISLERASNIETADVNGMPAAIVSGVTGGQAVRAMVVFLNNQAYVVALVVRSPELLDRYGGAFYDSVRSFRRASSQTNVRPYRIRLITAQPGITFAALAARSPWPRNAEGYLRTLNGYYPRGEPKPGQALKIIE